MLRDALGVGRCSVRRLLTLACLAPDIVAAMVRGEEPSGLSLEKLTKGSPLAWNRQRQTLLRLNT